MKKKLEKYFEVTKDVEYEDEKVQSNILNISLSTSYKELELLKKSGNHRSYEEANRWLYNLCNKIARIPVISLDALKMQVDSELKSCDGFFYSAHKSAEGYSLLVEFKNVNRSKILEFIGSEDDDSLYFKVRDSVGMIKNNIEFEDGYTGEELVSKIHFIIVYGERNDTVSTVNLGFKKVERASKDYNGRQNRAVSVERGAETSIKKEEEIFRKFESRLQSLGLIPCVKGHFGVPVKDPRIVKIKGAGKLYHFTMFSKDDFAKLVGEVDYFKSWNWGRYAKYFSCPVI